MHSCEAMLAAFDATGEPRYLERASAIAEAVTALGADVTLISGPTSLAPPAQAVASTPVASLPRDVAFQQDGVGCGHAFAAGVSTE